jgi:intracellular septation protein
MMPVVTAVVVMVFGGLTLYLNDETFIKMKPTIIYGLFAAILFAGLMLGKSFIKILFDNFWDLSDEGWKKLTIRLAFFFLLMAVANEFIWRNFSTELWVNIKVFGFTAATFLFFIAQVPLITRHAKSDTPDKNA